MNDAGERLAARRLPEGGGGHHRPARTGRRARLGPGEVILGIETDQRGAAVYSRGDGTNSLTTPNSPGSDAFAAAVATYRDAMSTAIVRVLLAAYGQNLTGAVADALDERRRAPFLLLRRVGRAVEDVIGVSDYPSIVEAHWDLFGQYFSNDRDAIRRMRVVEELVTVTRDLSATDAAAGIADIADLVAGVGEPAQVEGARAHLEAVGSAVTGLEQQAEVEQNADPAHDEGEGAARAQSGTASPPRRAGAEQADADRTGDAGIEADRDAVRLQVDEVREAQAILRRDVTTFEATEVAARQSLEASLANVQRAQRVMEARVQEQDRAIAQRLAEIRSPQPQLVPVEATEVAARQSLEASLAPVQRAQRGMEARVKEQDRVIEQQLAGIRSINSRIAELEQAPRDPQPRPGPVAGGRTRNVGSLLVAAAQWAVVGIILAVILHVAGVADLQKWPPEPGPLFGVSDVDGPDAPAAGTPTRGGNQSGSQDVTRSGSATATVPTGATPTPAGATPAPTGVVASGSMLPQAFIANTGADGMGPGGEGVGHYRACVLDDHFLVSETRWPEGTAVNVVEIGMVEDGCFGWLLVGIDGMTTWVREEYVVTRMDGVSGSVFDAANTALSSSDVHLRLAIFTDIDGNKHWLFVEDYGEQELPDRHLTDSRGMTGTSWQTTNGDNDGLSASSMDLHGKILALGSKLPQSRLFETHKDIPGIRYRLMYTRYQWFTERGIELGSYVEIFELPILASADGVPE